MKDTKGKWQWGGCSHDIRFGGTFSKEFIDSIENVSTPAGLMNIHNLEAGRRVSLIELFLKKSYLTLINKFRHFAQIPSWFANVMEFQVLVP